MFQKAIELINILENNNYKAYIVGGFVRDYLLNIKTDDIDISTSAKRENIELLFGKENIISETLGSLKLKYDKYMYEITTFREEREYINNRKPSSINYTDSIEKDVLRRDLTINGLYMDKEKNIIDLVDGISDINNKVIKSIGEPNKKMEEDALRILRAIRFSAKLGFKIDDELENAILNQKGLLKNISYQRKREELEKIFSLDNYKEGISLLNKYGLSDVLEISVNNNIIKTSNILGIWAQIDYSINYTFSNKEKDILNGIKSIINNKSINNESLFKYGLDINIIAGEILGYKYNINKMYDNLKIHSRNEIDITSPEISSLLSIDINNTKSIMEDIEKQIINDKINNNKKELTKYILENYRR